MKIFVTGGAGYIGSHVVKFLGEKTGYNLTIIDNLSTGFRESVLYGDLIVADLGNYHEIENILRSGDFDAVIHFAANIEVEESVINPLKYYRNNTVNAINLIELCVKYNVNRFVFSSTAAVYGNPDNCPVNEEFIAKPVNPYGASKLFVENILKDTAIANPDFRFGILRYFNVAGASSDGTIGQRTPNATHLIKVACQAALGQRDSVLIFGTDYETPDGTGVRDYIHVDDLASAHLEVLNYIESKGSEVFNCGYGTGFSVRQVLEAVKKASCRDFLIKESSRRPGDAVSVVADNKKILELTDWEPQYNDLEYICRTAFEWEKKMSKR